MKTIYVLACGPSINDITENQWKYLETQETIGFSRFALKNKKTKYYMFTEGFTNDKFPLTTIKRNGFLDTIIYTHNDELYNYATSSGFREVYKIQATRMLKCFNGIPWISGEKKPGLILDNFGNNINESLIAFRGQLSTAINLAYTMNPTEIRLVGVDLNVEDAFFTKDSKYSSISKYMDDVKNKKADKLDKWDKNTIHSTACPMITEKGKVVSVIPFLYELSIELKEKGINMYVSSKKSKLYTDKILNYKDITE
jgi:hypothetical protein